MGHQPPPPSTASSAHAEPLGRRVRGCGRSRELLRETEASWCFFCVVRWEGFLQENHKTVDLRNMQDSEHILHGTGRTLKVLGDSVLVQQPLTETSFTWASPYKPKLFNMGYTARFSQAGKEDISNYFTLHGY